MDADACPVKNQVVHVAKKLDIQVIMVVDDTHILDDGYSSVITVEKGKDSVDLKLINIANKDDIIVTQDYGVATMALAKKAYAINQNGMIYDDKNIEQLLMERHFSQKARRAGIRTKGPKKRSKEQDFMFESNFMTLCSKIIKNNTK